MSDKGQLAGLVEELNSLTQATGKTTGRRKTPIFTLVNSSLR